MIYVKCANPACLGELFKVTFDQIRFAEDESMGVELTCAKCGKRVKAWITNEQMKEVNRQMKMMNQTLFKWSEDAREFSRLMTLLLDLVKKKTKPWWKRW